mgnify:CR=1 FL=1
MKLSIERGTLLKALAQAQSVVERRNTIPILANVLIEAEGNQVSLRATDLDIEVVDKAPVAFWRVSKQVVAQLRRTFGELYCLVDTRHTRARAWLERLGFTGGWLADQPQ